MPSKWKNDEKKHMQCLFFKGGGRGIIWMAKSVRSCKIQSTNPSSSKYFALESANSLWWSDLRKGDFSLDLRKVLEISGHGSAATV